VGEQGDSVAALKKRTLRLNATNAPTPEIPFWQLVFMNDRIFFVGSDDVPADAKIDATRAINQALEAGWRGLEIAEIVPLDEVARAHELVEHPV
jgi:NADPH2:quinone reductase